MRSGANKVVMILAEVTMAIIVVSEGNNCCSTRKKKKNMIDRKSFLAINGLKLVLHAVRVYKSMFFTWVILITNALKIDISTWQHLLSLSTTCCIKS